MADDTRRRQKTNRRRVVKDVKGSQAAAGAESRAKPKPKRKAKPNRQADRRLKGSPFEKVCKLLARTVYEKDAQAIYEFTDDPGKDTFKLVNKLLRTYAFSLLATQRLLQDALGTPREDGIRAFMDDLRKNARCMKDICSGLLKARQHYFEEDLDNAPDNITLIGSDVFRGQLTTVAGPLKSVN